MWDPRRRLDVVGQPSGTGQLTQNFLALVTKSLSAVPM